MLFFKRPLICYLAGPMEYAENMGLNWRLDYRKKLDLLKIRTIVPNFEEQEIMQDLETFKNDKIYHLDRYIRKMRKIIKCDLDLIKKSTFIITKWDGEMSTGTFSEAQFTYLNNIPNYLITSYDYKNIPGWFLACCTELFHNEDELFNFIKLKYRRQNVNKM